VRAAAGGGGPNVRHGSVVAKPEQRFAVVVGRFNDLVTKLLLQGANGAFEAHGVSMANVEVRWRGRGSAPLRMLLLQVCRACVCVQQVLCTRLPRWVRAREPPPRHAPHQVCWVPGSFELPVVAKAMAKSGKFDAVVAIGVVVSPRCVGCVRPRAPHTTCSRDARGPAVSGLRCGLVNTRPACGVCAHRCVARPRTTTPSSAPPPAAC
jgi:hypothetical protein